jgi:transcriptional regulator with XRE-family HTH domain
MKKFGDVLKALREEQGLTQSDLANGSGLTQKAISRYEAEGAEPGWDSVCKLADTLGVSTEVFRGLVKPSKSTLDTKKVRITVTLLDGEDEIELGKLEKKIPQ